MDDVPDKTRLPENILARLLEQLDSWERRIRAAYAGRPGEEPLDLALAAAVRTFPVPLGHWLEFIDAMRFDVRHPRFADFEEFLRYGEGATVAPTAMYVYLLTSRRQPDGRYLVEDFDYVGCGRELGRFAYVAHVLRDVRADLRVGETGLVYLSRSDMAKHGLTDRDLFELTGGTPRAHLLERWHSLVLDMCGRARVMRSQGAGMARSTWESLPRDCEFIFRLIVAMYAELLDRIEADPARVLRPGRILSSEDKAGLLEATAAATGFILPPVSSAGALLETG